MNIVKKAAPAPWLTATTGPAGFAGCYQTLCDP
ncbi:hypothetical protein XINFAN_01641 [Pseudogemmobacter humi]|uniref:Uncharacterized protein n=1 Tax=Pseudogemmobacter humi TaxID=2483812 RepID=A0A3P5WY14_9RHOB|nr:hypothetical protein XINFAN_01641 [Pseudogemmobacter humi]